jgi:murein DD-endopeptidase MepM/ murein hydrolase activator NlpD
MPIDGVSRAQLHDSFDERRAAGLRRHEALDIMAPRGTPVRAVEAGRVAKLFRSVAGGLTVYLFDSAETFSYYYAHLDRYAAGLHEGQQVRRGELIAYVGSTGNASEDAPHLHFAVFQLGAERRWWQGTPINPYAVLRQR